MDGVRPREIGTEVLKKRILFWESAWPSQKVIHKAMQELAYYAIGLESRIDELERQIALMQGEDESQTV